MMRRSGTVGLGRPAVNYAVTMEKDSETGWWTTSVPLTAGANQYWFNELDANGTNITLMLPDSANMPIWSPGNNWNPKNACNAVYVPYGPVQDYEPLAARAAAAPPEPTEKEARLHGKLLSSRAQRGIWACTLRTDMIPIARSRTKRFTYCMAAIRTSPTG